MPKRKVTEPEAETQHSTSSSSAGVSHFPHPPRIYDNNTSQKLESIGVLLSILPFVILVLYLISSFIPQPLLHQWFGGDWDFGSARVLALYIPTLLIVASISTPLVMLGKTILQTPAVTHLSTIKDHYTKLPFIPSAVSKVPDLSDLQLSNVSRRREEQSRYTFA